MSRSYRKHQTTLRPRKAHSLARPDAPTSAPRRGPDLRTHPDAAFQGIEPSNGSEVPLRFKVAGLQPPQVFFAAERLPSRRMPRTPAPIPLPSNIRRTGQRRPPCRSTRLNRKDGRPAAPIGSSCHCGAGFGRLVCPNWLVRYRPPSRRAASPGRRSAMQGIVRQGFIAISPWAETGGRHCVPFFGIEVASNGKIELGQQVPMPFGRDG